MTDETDIIGGLIGEGEPARAFADTAMVWSDMGVRVAVVRGYREGRAAGMKELMKAVSEDAADLASEIRSVLEQLDHLADVWGDEGVFRTCRDRLRALLPEGK